jgi:hypothetical protein
MLMKDARIAWTPVYYPPGLSRRGKTLRPGAIEAGPRQPTGWMDDYACWDNADQVAMLDDKSKAARLAMLFITFHHIVVRDGINPVEAHKAFMKIAEFRDCMADDLRTGALPAWATRSRENRVSPVFE